ncbi:hypothetical protein N9R04_03865 [Staphylococcus sp. SQ8-PEA]|uniref:Uncharacterized protein n=1 Tax=Staphylococcus marylandisciuri TaxID=2981529 RepID=A0ABT2QPF9_9STAP|nr:hypothetical protein [Staphylococcus marylandisciuri]MCU5745858.1 hypothetical protein [Staphylococcus marylandisciuri]
MLIKFAVLFILLVISSMITLYLTHEGTWPNLLFKSLSLSIIIVFLFHYIRFLINFNRN